MELTEMHVIFRGSVQGVGFRYTAKAYALELGIVGEVRNLADGSVELYAQGSKEKLDLLVKKLEDFFAVDRPSKVSFRKPMQLFKGFSISR